MELHVTDEQRNWFCKMEATSGDDSMKIVEMRAMNLEYYINLVD